MCKFHLENLSGTITVKRGFWLPNKAETIVQKRQAELAHRGSLERAGKGDKNSDWRHTGSCEEPGGHREAPFPGNSLTSEHWEVHSSKKQPRRSRRVASVF